MNANSVEKHCFVVLNVKLQVKVIDSKRAINFLNCYILLLH